jgi:hypothetical protein
MKMQRLAFAALLSLVLLSSCAKQPAPADGAPHATVVMRDGSRIPGKVTESSTTELKLAGDDGIARTIPMTQVKAVEYSDAPAAPAAPPAEATAPASAPAPASAAAPASRPASPATGSPVPVAATPPTPAPATPRSAPAPEEHVHATAAAVTTKTYEVPAGTEVAVRNDEAIDSGKAVEGQTFAATVTRDVHDAAGAVVIPRGANAQIVIVSASKGGKIRGASDLSLDLATVSIEGRRYQLSTSEIVQRGKEGVGINKRTGEYAGGGAAIGAIIGAIAGGGKGAAIGAGAGAGAGAIGQVLTKGGSIKVPVESVLTFKLDRALRVNPQ